MMKQRAYHKLTLENGTIVHGPLVVCFDDDEKFLSWHLLEREEPFTEWVGGHFEVKKV